MIADLFSTYFLPIADELIANSASGNNGNWKNYNLLNYLFQTFEHPFTNVKLTYIFTKKIEKIIQSLKEKIPPPFSTLTHKK